ncbi:glycerate kinase, partial [Acinetobacter baumannii]|nr:glycerate kinase [Acinetobacter baumannii]
QIPPGVEGLASVRTVDLTAALDLLADVELVALADVDNPLVGKRGAIRVFGPQKGLADHPTPRGTCATL